MGRSQRHTVRRRLTDMDDRCSRRLHPFDERLVDLSRGITCITSNDNLATFFPEGVRRDSLPEPFSERPVDLVRIAAPDIVPVEDDRILSHS
jgi:hypothetical protein